MANQVNYWKYDIMHVLYVNSLQLSSVNYYEALRMVLWRTVGTTGHLILETQQRFTASMAMNSMETTHSPVKPVDNGQPYLRHAYVRSHLFMQ